MFDFETAEEADCKLTHTAWQSLFISDTIPRVALRLDRRVLAEKLIQNTFIAEDDPAKKRCIPFVEVWYPEPIPLAALESFIILQDDPQSDGIRFEEHPEDKIAEIARMAEMLLKRR